MLRFFGSLGATTLLPIACASAPPPAPLPPPPPPPAPPSAAPEAAPTAAAGVFPASDEDDPNESADPIPLAGEISRPWNKATFPPKTGDEEKCWQSVSLTGNPDKDFDALITSCGTPLGLKEYVTPAHGHLHSVKDKRDTFVIKLFKGLCYRYFAVGDSGIKNIDILVEKKGNVLVGDDKQTGPVAVIDAGKPWCMNEDAEYLFNIEVGGVGAGKYIFGVWARPK
jgi:hypothetical protein